MVDPTNYKNTRGCWSIYWIALINWHLFLWFRHFICHLTVVFNQKYKENTAVKSAIINCTCVKTLRTMKSLPRPGWPCWSSGIRPSRHSNLFTYMIQSLTRVSISKNSRREITLGFPSRAGEMNFHVSFSSRFSRFWENISLSPLGSQDFCIELLFLLSIFKIL